ncbi:MAG: hypothetical protein JWL76_521 [Thermoleophilia bacterium]|nr:hypothetical protein [Thermoleophilia bacterium]
MQPRMPDQPSSTRPLVTIGVDLATAPAATGLCVLDVPTMRATIVPTPAERTITAIAELAAHWWAETGGRLRIGIDAPFGWPAGWVELLTRARELGDVQAGVSAQDGSHAIAQPLRWRLTDVELSAWSHRALRPMTPSMDRLAATTVRCVDLAHLRDAGIPVARDGALADGTPSAAFEVYPTASLFAWGLVAKGGRREARSRFLSEVSQRIEAPGLGASHEHDVDSLIAALTVAGSMRAMRPEDGDPRVLAIEGVMHVPEDPASG